MRAWLESRARRSPGATAVLSAAGEHSWSDLLARARARAAALAARGVGPGDVVATLLDHDVAALEILHGAWLRGAVALPLDRRASAPELGALLALAAPRLLVHDADAGAAARAVAASGLAVELAEAATLLAPPVDVPVLPAVDGAGLAALLGTSGTSGRPKLVALERRALAASALGSALRIGVRSGDRWLASLRPVHVGGLSILSRAVLLGTAVVLPDPAPPGARGFDPARFVAQAMRDSVTVASLVPTMLRRVLDDGLAPPESLRCVLIGGAPLDATSLARARAMGWPVAPTYGLTEAASQVATGAPGESHPPGSSGSPLDTAWVDVRDGEICVRGPTLMRGYHGDPAATSRAFRGGWLRTGDLGRLDEEGRLEVRDRRDDLVVSGGENVAPAEVEAALADHPDVCELAVAGEDDPDLGRRVAVWVVARDGAAPTLESLRRHARGRLAPFKLPRALHLVDELPRTSSGKIRRAALQGLT